ncbi:MFS transporter [Vreelandella stevensii]|uniref:MFS transporter n=1 Tax=Vreelandella stevensii TaxID=502821 RepID=UPI002351DAA2|nr:MFS transporter [Halomonas stevensii]
MFCFLVFLYSSCKVFDMLATRKIVAEISMGYEYVKTNTLIDISKRAGRLTGPLVAYLMLFYFSESLIFVLTMVFHVFICFSCYIEIVVPKEKNHNNRELILQSLKNSLFRYFRNSKLARLAFLYVFINPVYSISLWVFLPVYYDEIMLSGERGYSFAMFLLSLGAMMSSILIYKKGIKDEMNSVLLGFIVFSLGFFLLSLSTGLLSSFLSILIISFGIPLFDVGSASIVNSESSKKDQAKFYSLFRCFAELGLAIGLLAGGHLIDIFGYRNAASTISLIYIFLLTIALIINLKSREKGKSHF